MSNENNAVSVPNSQDLQSNVPGEFVSPDVAREVSRIQGMIVSAKRFPRDEDFSRDKILKACARVKLAENAMYSYSKGGAPVTGPSIRLAETMAKSWGNINFGIREISQDNGESLMEAFAWDLEANTIQTKSFIIGHQRHTKKGVKTLTDTRDVYEHTANFAARRLRACILGIIPQDIIEDAIEACDKTLKGGSDDSLKERIPKMIEQFKKYEVTQEHIEKRIMKNVDAMDSTEFVQLQKIFVSMRDGMSKASDWFQIGSIQSESAKDLTDQFKK